MVILLHSVVSAFRNVSGPSRFGLSPLCFVDRLLHIGRHGMACQLVSEPAISFDYRLQKSVPSDLRVPFDVSPVYGSFNNGPTKPGRLWAVTCLSQPCCSSCVVPRF